jgi:hypothetical protein
MSFKNPQPKIQVKITLPFQHCGPLRHLPCSTTPSADSCTQLPMPNAPHAWLDPKVVLSCSCILCGHNLLRDTFSPAVLLLILIRDAVREGSFLLCLTIKSFSRVVSFGFLLHFPLRIVVVIPAASNLQMMRFTAF